MSVADIGVKSQRPGRHQGKAMHILVVDPDKCFARDPPRARILVAADVVANCPSAHDKKDIPSDAPYRGKKTFGSTAHRAGINLFEKYGSFPPDPARPMAYHDYPDEFLSSLIHTEHDKHRQHEIDQIAEQKSAFDRNLIGRRVPRMYNPEFIHPFAENYDPKRDSKGLLGALTEKASDAPGVMHTGKKSNIFPKHSILTPEPFGTSIPGFPGVAVGQVTKYDRIDMKKPQVYPRHLEPLGPPGLTTRTDDRRPKPESYDPLAFKRQFNSPGDPNSIPRHVKMIDVGPSEAQAALRGEALRGDGSPGEDPWPQPHPTGTKHFEEHMRPELPGVVPGFMGMGREAREQHKQHGRRLLAPDGVHPSQTRCKSSIF